MLSPGHKGVAVFTRLDGAHDVVVDGEVLTTHFSDDFAFRSAHWAKTYCDVDCQVIHVKQKRRDWAKFRSAH